VRGCKHLFVKKVHLIAFFTNCLEFQSDSKITTSNLRNPVTAPDRPRVEKNAQNPAFRPCKIINQAQDRSQYCRADSPTPDKLAPKHGKFFDL